MYFLTLILTNANLYYSDLGILSARPNMTIKSLLSNESDRFRGIYTENYVTYHPAYAIRISTKNFGMTENVKADEKQIVNRVGSATAAILL